MHWPIVLSEPVTADEPKLPDEVTFGFSRNLLMKATRHLRPGGSTNSVADKRVASCPLSCHAMIHDKARPLKSYRFKVINYE